MSSPHERLAKCEAELADARERITKLERVIGAIAAVFGGGGADCATDRELNHPEFGDPEVKSDPRDWKGPPMAGRRYSECPPDYLELLADRFDYFEQKNRASGAKTSNGKLKADFDKRSARLARGWARRLLGGWKPPPKPAPVGFGAQAPAAGGNPFAPRPPADPGPQTETRAKEPAQLNVPADDAAEPDDCDDSFSFGANAPAKAGGVELVDEDDEDEPPLVVGGAA